MPELLADEVKRALLDSCLGVWSLCNGLVEVEDRGDGFAEIKLKGHAFGVRCREFGAGTVSALALDTGICNDSEMALSAFPGTVELSFGEGSTSVNSVDELEQWLMTRPTSLQTIGQRFAQGCAPL